MCKSKSAILEALRKTAKGLHAAGLMDQITLHDFDRPCLPPVQALQAEEIKNIREESHVNQAVLQHF